MTSNLMSRFHSTTSVFKRSGRHVKQSTKGDLAKIVGELVTHQAFRHTPGQEVCLLCKTKAKPIMRV